MNEGKSYTAIRAYTMAMIKKSGTLAPRAFIALLFAFLGFASNDLWRFHHTYVLSNLTVISRESKNTYWVQRNDEPIGQAFPFVFCPDYIPEMNNGDSIEVVVFEAKFNPPCHDVGGGKNGIIFYSKKGP
jgi:hypothetical protein